jgi:hypothetical protein
LTNLGIAREPPSGRTVGLLVAAVVAACTALAAVMVRGPGPAAATLAVPAPGAVLGRAGPSWAVVVPEGQPLRVRAPAIGVSADLVLLGLNPDGTLEVPGYDDAGWYSLGTRPGATGPAVIAAHLDSTSGPSVFHRLGELDPGDAVHVDYAEGTVTFVVRGSGSYEKDAFPTAFVYGPTPGHELRLITCDGSFDRRARSYSANLVVWAAAVPT